MLRSPATHALAYRTLAAASGRGADSVDWRTAEHRRRFTLDRRTLDATASRLLRDELVRLGLASPSA